MECNKEEAIRAKCIADKKMQSKDFIGARKMILKAQKLFPDIENLSQMRTVCEVHCAAEVKVNGSEDWYGILQVEPTANDSLIKKQYKKLAFLLHPDKNKFPGAEAAFKLLGEAHRILTDQTKRSVYDLKVSSIQIVGPNPPPHCPRTSGSRKQPAVTNSFKNHAATSFANLNQGWSRHHQTQATNTSQTFWTMCPSCKIKYQYYRSMINKSLHCPNCLHPFNACEHDVLAGVNTDYPFSHAGSHQHKHCDLQKEHASQGGSGSSHMDTGIRKSQGRMPTVLEPVTGASVQGYGKKAEGSVRPEKKIDRQNKVKVGKVELETLEKRESTVRSSGHGNQKRRKLIVEFGETDDSDNEIFFQDTRNTAASNIARADSHHPRRSTRQKQNVTYNENHSDGNEYEIPNISESMHCEKLNDKTFIKDEAKEPTVTSPVSKSSSGDIKRGTSTEEDIKRRNDRGMDSTMRKLGGLRGIDTNQDDGVSLNSYFSLDKSNIVSYSDPEFHDFEKFKCSTRFTVGQIWALYDDMDSMPRFYARIKSVSSNGFKVQFTWLEYNPVNQAEIDWYNADLPIGCGNFMLGETEESDNIDMFSHLMPCMKGPKRNCYVIYPRKGEIWALFRCWDFKWTLNPGEHRHAEYDVVEILSDFSVSTGGDVLFLVKVNGFVSLFCQRVGSGACTIIPPSEFLRLSHLVPAHRMTGKEREGIQEGMYELDTASLPVNMEEMFPSVTLDEIRGDFRDMCHKKGTQATVSFEDNYTLGNNTERNMKTEDEMALKGSSQSEAHEKETIGGKSKFAAAHAETHVHEKRPVPLSEKENDSNATSTSTDDAAGNHNDTAPYPSSPMRVKYPEPEFYDFDLDRSKERFEAGQVWALYCEDDGFPKYYAVLRKVELGDFKVHLTWLEACPLLSPEEVNWSQNNLPFGCGIFKTCSGREAKEAYETVETFSHLVRAKHDEKKKQYAIYPQANEVWALYRNWKMEWKLADLENCLEQGEYDLVEVTYRSDTLIAVNVLEKVDGFIAVFRPRRKNGSLITMEITRNHFLRFSHRIPSVRLTEERGGKLRDCWELDPASVPDILLCTGTN